MSQASTELSDASLTRIEAAQPAADYGHLAAQGHAYVIVLRITDFYVSAYNLLAPGSRVHLVVSGEVVDTATNERRLAADWSHSGDYGDPATLAENEGELLKAHMKRAWAAIASDIAQDIFAPGPFGGALVY